MEKHDEKVEAYIAKQKSPQKEICQTLIKLIHKALPGVKEEMRWGVPTFREGAIYVAALKDHVNVGFSLEGLSAEDRQLLEGGGKTMRHLKFFKVQDIEEAKLVSLLKRVRFCTQGCL